MRSLHEKRKKNSDMDKKKTKKIILCFFFLALIILVGGSMLILSGTSDNEGFDDKDYIEYDKGWDVSCGDRDIKDVSLPISEPIGSYPEVVCFRNTLPDNIKDSWYIALPTSLQSVWIYVDGKRIAEYSGGESMFSTCVPANKWFFAKLSQEMSGKEIRMETNSRVSDYHGCVQEVYLGDESDISYKVARDKWYIPVTGTFLFMSGLCFMILNFFAIKMGNPDFSDIYMFGYLMVIGVWFMMSSTLSQGIVGDVALSRAIEFYALMFLAIPIIRHVENIVDNRHVATAVIISLISLLSIPFITLCVYLAGEDYMALNWITLTILAVTIVFGAYSFLRLMKEDAASFRKVRTFLIGTICFGVGAGAEIIFALIDPLDEGGQFISIGAIVYVLFIFHWENNRNKVEGEARERAVSQANAKGTFLANMSHEIRTPVNAIIAIDQMIMSENTESQVISYAEDIRVSSHELLALINKVLDSARIEYGKMKIFASEYSTYDFALEVLKMADDKGEGSVKINFRYAHDMPSMMNGDKNRIVQIMGYLLENAVKHTDDGNIVIGMNVKRKDDTECILEMCVADTGCGIAESEIDDIFGSFRKDERESSGMGLGLYLARQFTGMMDGSINVRSIKNVGSVFTVEMPQKIVDGSDVGDICSLDDTSHSFGVLNNLHMLIVMTVR